MCVVVWTASGACLLSISSAFVWCLVFCELEDAGFFWFSENQQDVGESGEIVVAVSKV